MDRKDLEIEAIKIEAFKQGYLTALQAMDQRLTVEAKEAEKAKNESASNSKQS